MPWRPSDCTGNDFLQDACQTENFRTLASASKRNRFVCQCTTQDVPGMRGHRNLNSMCGVNSNSNRRRARGLYPPPQ
ncbi:hypothetical protein TNIN_253551, partial [Trichonephila inaurata madagascariensis]